MITKHDDHLALAAKITHLRLTAAAIFDRLVGAGAPPEEVQKALNPVQKHMADAIVDAVTHNPAAAAFAVVNFEHQVGAFEADIAYLRQKITDTRQHIDMVKKAFAGRLVGSNRETLECDGFLVTMVKAGKDPASGVTVTIR